MTLYLTAATADAACEAVVSRVDGGAGTPTLQMTTTPGTYDAGTILGEFLLATPRAFSVPSGNASSLNGAPRSTNALISGAPAEFRVRDGDGTELWSGDITALAMGGDLEGDTGVEAGNTIVLDAYTFSTPTAGISVAIGSGISTIAPSSTGSTATAVTMDGLSQAVPSSVGGVPTTSPMIGESTVAPSSVGDSNDFEILFIDDNGNAVATPPVHMVPVPYTVTLVRDDNTLTVDLGSNRLTKSGIFWNFGDASDPYMVQDPDARLTGERTAIWGTQANLSDRQYGTSAAYPYRHAGTYLITCTILMEDGSVLQSRVSVNPIADTRPVIGTVGVEYANLAAGVADLGDNEVLEIARGYSETLECPSPLGDTYGALLTQTNSLVRAAAGPGAAPELRMSYRVVGGGAFRCFGFSATARRTGVIGMQIVPDNNDLSFFYEGGGQPGSLSGFEFLDNTCVNCWHADTVFGGTDDTAAPGTGADYGCLTGFTTWGDRATACHEINQTVLPGEGYILRYAHAQRQQARHCIIIGSETQGSAQEHLQRYLGDSQPVQHTSCWTHFADWQFDFDPSPQATKGYRFQSALMCGMTQSFIGSQIEFGFDGYNADDCQAVACYFAGMGNQSPVNFGGDNIRTSIRDCIVSQEQRYEPDGGFNLTPFDSGAHGVFDYQGECSELYVGHVSLVSLSTAGGGRTPPYTFQGSALVNVPSSPYEFRNIYHAIDDLNTQYLIRAYGLDVGGRWLWEYCAFPADYLVRSDGYENDGGPIAGGWRRPFATFQPTVDPSLTCTQVDDTGTAFIARNCLPLPSAGLDTFCPVTDGHQKDYRWIDRDRAAGGWQPGAISQDTP